MRVIVSHLSRKRFIGDVCGGSATLHFLLNGKTVHSEKFNGKCLSRYVRTLPDISFDCSLLECDEATSFIYEIER